MKAIKFQISHPIDTEWKVLGSTLRDVQYQNATLLNHCMTKFYLHQHDQELFKTATGKYPTKEEMPFPYLYPELRRMNPDLLSNNVSNLDRIAQLRWKQDRKDCYYKKEKALPTYRKTCAIPVHQQAWKITKDDSGYSVSFSLFSKSHEGQKRFGVMLNTKKTTSSFIAVLNRLISGEYKKCQLLITKDYRKPKWFVSFVYEPGPRQDVKPNDDAVVGINMGIVYSFWASNNQDSSYINSDGADILRFRIAIRAQRRSIQNQYPLSGRKGHGRKRALLPTTSISEKEQRFRDCRYHQYSRAFIEYAVKVGAKTIQIKSADNLSPIVDAKGKPLRMQANYLPEWAISDLTTKVKNKAAEAGIDIVEVSNPNISYRCSKCGDISKLNKPEFNRFLCRKCGLDIHPDKNDSINLSVKDIDKVIADTLASGDVVVKTPPPLEG